MRDSGVPVTVEAIANVPAMAAFDTIVPIPLPKMFTGYGPLPAIEATRDQTGDWDHAGPTRTIDFTDGSTAHEEITDYERPRYFAYEVSGFTNSLRVLVHGARGEWWFSPGPAGSTEIRWRYTFKPRGAARPIVALLVARLWRGYARKALALAVTEAERGASP